MSAIMLKAWLVAGIICLMATFADAATVSSSGGAKASVSASFAPKAQCLIAGLESAGVRIKFMGGYGNRPRHYSKHPSGRAIDINQWRRDVTSPAIPRAVGNSVAHACGLISGGAWRRRPDNGHFEESGGGSKRGRR